MILIKFLEVITLKNSDKDMSRKKMESTLHMKLTFQNLTGSMRSKNEEYLFHDVLGDRHVVHG